MLLKIIFLSKLKDMATFLGKKKEGENYDRQTTGHK